MTACCKWQILLTFSVGFLTGIFLSTFSYGTTHILLDSKGLVQETTDRLKNVLRPGTSHGVDYSPTQNNLNGANRPSEKTTGHHDTSHGPTGSRLYKSDEGMTTRSRYILNDLQHHHDDTNVAESLAKKVRVACLILTTPKNIESRAIHVYNTWSKRCNKLFFMSSEPNSKLPVAVIRQSRTEDSYSLTEKTFLSFKYAYENIFDEADWFFKADDDTYAIMENMRYFLSDKNTSKPFYFGQRFMALVRQGYNSGGAGYILSKEALRRLVQKGLNNEMFCKVKKGIEDLELGKCMENLGIPTADTRDTLGRSRFHCLPLADHILGLYPDWYIKYDNVSSKKKGIESISDYAITFHYVTPNDMYKMEFNVYHLRPYGVYTRAQDINAPPTQG